jgi:hypothetical protein
MRRLRKTENRNDRKTKHAECFHIFTLRP